MINYKNSTQKTDSKIIWIELLRIFACFGVVLLHTSAIHFNDIHTNTFIWQVFNFYNGISRYSVPIFIMISGLLYLNKANHITLKKLYSKYILRMLTVYIFWSIFYGFFDWIFVTNHNGHIIDIIKESIKYSINTPKYHLWYIPIIIGLLIITPILKEIINSQSCKKVCEYFIILFFIFKIIENSLILFNIPHIDYIKKIFNLVTPYLVCSWVGYYILGYYLLNYKLMNKKYNTILSITGCLTILLGIVLNWYFSFKTGNATVIFYDNFTIFQMFYVVSIFYFFKNTISKIKWSKGKINVISKLSSCTLGIYLFHPLVRDVLQKFKFDTFIYSPIIFVPLFALFIFFTSFLIIYLIKRIPYLNKWII